MKTVQNPWLLQVDGREEEAIECCMNFAFGSDESIKQRGLALIFAFEHYVRKDIVDRVKGRFKCCSTPEEQVELLLGTMDSILDGTYQETGWDFLSDKENLEKVTGQEIVTEQQNSETFKKDMIRLLLTACMLGSLYCPWYFTLFTIVSAMVLCDLLTTAHGTGPLVMCGEKIVHWAWNNYMLDEADEPGETIEPDGKIGNRNNGAPAATEGNGPPLGKSLQWKFSRKRPRTSNIEIGWADKRILFAIGMCVCVIPTVGPPMAVAGILLSGIICNPILHLWAGMDHNRVFRLLGTGENYQERVSLSKDMLGWKTHKTRKLN